MEQKREAFMFSEPEGEKRSEKAPSRRMREGPLKCAAYSFGG